MRHRFFLIGFQSNLKSSFDMLTSMYNSKSSLSDLQIDFEISCNCENWFDTFCFSGFYNFQESLLLRTSTNLLLGHSLNDFFLKKIFEFTNRIILLSLVSWHFDCVKFLDLGLFFRGGLLFDYYWCWHFLWSFQHNWNYNLYLI